ncbi:MAG TPA: desulfoferrodoxin family protein [Clostridia bacterium]|nr:desulfoferrodoxin family protein [Clostridia bacterium]
MCSEEFYVCKHCGNVAVKLFDSGSSLVCCGEAMSLLEPNTVEASVEKHLPVVTISGDKVLVEIGSAEHPMIDTHYIAWIYLATDRGGSIACLKPGDKPKATFTADGKVKAVYEYCNLHGLWKTEVK